MTFVNRALNMYPMGIQRGEAGQGPTKSHFNVQMTINTLSVPVSFFTADSKVLEFVATSGPANMGTFPRSWRSDWGFEQLALELAEESGDLGATL